MNPTDVYYSGHGDLAAEADQTGTRTRLLRLDPWGQPLTAPGGPDLQELYTGRWDKKHDQVTSLIEMGVRPYEAALGRFLSVDPVDGGSSNEYDYTGQDPLNGYDLDGRICDWCKKKAKATVKKAKKAADVVAQVVQEVPYAVCYGSYTALDQARRHHLPVPTTARAVLIGSQAAGLAGDAAIDRARGKSMWDDARRDSVLPNSVAKRWNPKFAQWYLPGMGYDAHGKKKIDFRT